MDETVRQANSELQAENQKLQTLNTSLHKKYHTMSLKVITLKIVYNIVSHEDVTSQCRMIGYLK